MTDQIRAAAERLLKYLEANRGHDGMFPLSESQEEFNLRAALAAEPPAPAEPDTDAVLSLAAIIRRVDGSNNLGAAALAEAILSHLDATCLLQRRLPMTDEQLLQIAANHVGKLDGADLSELDLITTQRSELIAFGRAVEAELKEVNTKTSDDILPGPLSEAKLREQWNAQADEFNQWDSLDSDEQLAWAQVQAIAAHKVAPVPQPVPVAERPWERLGWCDEHGRCWWFAPTEAIAGGFRSAGWSLYAGPPADEDTYCLPYWAIPQPPKCGEVK